MGTTRSGAGYFLDGVQIRSKELVLTVFVGRNRFFESTAAFLSPDRSQCSKYVAREEIARSEEVIPQSLHGHLRQMDADRNMKAAALTQKFLKQTRGAAFANYAILVGLISTVTLGATALMGTQINELFTHASNGIEGEEISIEMAHDGADDEAVAEFVDAYFKGAGDTVILDSATSITPEFYAETEPGDLLVATVLHRSDLVAPSGWTEAASQKNNGYQQWISVLAKTFEDGEDLRATFYQVEENRLLANVTTISGTNPMIVSASTGAGYDAVRSGLYYQVAKEGSVLIAGVVDAYGLTDGSATEYGVDPGWTLTTPASAPHNRLASAVSTSRGAEPGAWAKSTDFTRTDMSADWATALVQITSDGVAETELPADHDIPNSFDRASIHILGTSDSSEIAQDDSGDVWRMDLTETQDVHFELAAEDQGNGAMDFHRFRVYDASRNEIVDRYTSGSTPPQALLNQLTAGEYFIRVSGDVGGYRLTTTPIAYDVPNTFDGAASHTLGSSDSSDIVGGDSGDVWRMDLTETQDVHFELTAEDHGNGAMDFHRFRVYDASRNEIVDRYTSGSTPPQALLNQLTAGEYFIRVSGDVGGYRLTTTPAAYDVPNTFDGAASHTLGSSDSSDIVGGDSGDVWRMELTETQDVHFELTAEDQGNGAMDYRRFRVYDASRNEIVDRYTSGSSPSQALLNQLTAGEYFIQVSGDVGGYRLTTTPIAYDVPNTFDGAASHTLGSSDSSDIVGGDSGDVWRMELTETQDVHFELTAEDQGNGAMDYRRFRVYNASRNEIVDRYASGSTPPQALLNQLTAGEYFIQVSGDAGGYRLTTTPTAYDVPNTFDGAASHTLGSSDSSDIVGGDSGDVWRVVLSETQDVHFELVGEDQGDGAMDYRNLKIYDTMRRRIAYRYGSGSSKVEAPLTQLPAGEYFISVTGDIGGYRITTVTP